MTVPAIAAAVATVPATTVPVAATAAVPARPRPAVLAWTVVCAVWLLTVAACSRPAEPPHRLFGLAFGDAPTAELVRQQVPLPADVSQRLAFFTAPGRRETGWAGVVLTDPVLAFDQGRLFSIDAALAEAPAAAGLRDRLTRDFGPAHCRETARRTVCRWSADETELILERAMAGPARLMVRHRPTATAVAAVLPQGADGGQRE